MSPSWSVRVRTESRRATRVHVRKHSFSVGAPVSFDVQEELPSAIEMMLGAFAADLTGTVEMVARRRRVVLDATELSLTCHLENPLVHLGVVGEEGSPRVRLIEGTLYLSTDAEPEEVGALWQECLLRSPLYNTLKDAAQVSLRLRQTT